ncbi:adenosylmethionine-8-amino-7-oxononanoate aminotransferase [Jatrophihabitans endophyticus]|uniref:Adenosylmethionine-8-amino-7-oxononanoate aminotransferase n=1 Tax=Jatrophihabitans endophyticus TaxID=1206085 RepID=A0A1M5T247_9ACTN|nr:adenosylmethionine--8-amino-7-oxononanoate transaminase [Jatrophihabitans endophyticus]SHH44756.1 adenosylmethionine-8-amino-7-oxononanoate aminotransferase [Jatrophihabitans endophyticus]
MNLVERDIASVWHPFTQHSLWPADDPLVIDRAEGMRLYDSDGRGYLDGCSSLWVTVHGHAVPEINEAIRAQAQRLDHSTFLGLTHEPGIRVAEELLKIAPAGLSKVFFAGDGSSAAEAAIKIAYQAASQRGEDRPLYLHCAEGYHGDTLGAVSLGGVELFHATYRPLLIETRMVSSPGVLQPGETRAERARAVLAEMRALIEREGDRICAIVVEPLVQAAGGILTHDPEFLRGVRELCDTSGAAMLVDEVATGIGATGRWFAVEHAGVSPDLLVLGKRVTGGVLPLSAVLARDSVYEPFLGDAASARTFFHGHTYTANPLCCAAALANLELMHERGTVARAAEVGDRIGSGLRELAQFDGVAEIRRVGTMTGIEVRSVGERTGFEVCRAARRKGAIVRPLGDVVVLMPPLGIGNADLDELLGIVTESVQEVVR